MAIAFWICVEISVAIRRRIACVEPWLDLLQFINNELEAFKSTLSRVLRNSSGKERLTPFRQVLLTDFRTILIKLLELGVQNIIFLSFILLIVIAIYLHKVGKYLLTGDGGYRPAGGDGYRPTEEAGYRIDSEQMGSGSDSDTSPLKGIVQKVKQTIVESAGSEFDSALSSPGFLVSALVLEKGVKVHVPVSTVLLE
ncbi:hypothetical protein B7494_g7901 [Chlorociboria aeruginascens]|nr:hypothetical protein B7494_g7901 [Chlorociboria aeruginascens]